MRKWEGGLRDVGGWGGDGVGMGGLLVVGCSRPLRTGRRYRGGFDECGSEKLESIKGWGENSSCLCEAVAASQAEEMPGYNKIS